MQLAQCKSDGSQHHGYITAVQDIDVKTSKSDCAARFKGTSLNDAIHQGPNLLNNISGVFIRFRAEHVAVVVDMRSVFHPCCVAGRDKRFLRFLWWPEGNVTKSTEVYAMQVHLFEATSSPSVVDFCIQRKEFKDEIKNLQQDKQVAKSSALADLSPILENDLVKVGKRLGDSESGVVEHPMIFSRHFVAILIVQECNESVGYLGTEYTLSSVRKRFHLLKDRQVVERIVKSFKSVLRALVKQHLLTDEQLVTFMCEVEKILNDRPLAVVSGDAKDPLPLIPNHLLLLRRNNCAPTCGTDYVQQRWSVVQKIAGSFYSCSVFGCLPSLQERPKWKQLKENIRVNDIVLVVDENTPRGQWSLGLVQEVKVG